MGSEQAFEASRKSDKFGDFVKDLRNGNRGAAIDALVEAVVTIGTGTPILGAGAKEANRMLRKRAEAATERLLKEYERAQKLPNGSKSLLRSW